MQGMQEKVPRAADPHMSYVLCCCTPALSGRPLVFLAEASRLVQAAARKEAKQKRNANKWIFVTSADGQQLYVAPKVKGNFQHSSFLAGEHTSQHSGLGVPPLNSLYTGPNMSTCTAVPLLPLLCCDALPDVVHYVGCRSKHTAACSCMFPRLVPSFLTKQLPLCGFGAIAEIQCPAWRSAAGRLQPAAHCCVKPGAQP